MLQAATRVAHNVEAETRAYEIRMRAARKAGALSKKIEKVQGARSDLCGERAQVGKLKTLTDAGISHQQASDWERLSDVPDETAPPRRICDRFFLSTSIDVVQPSRRSPFSTPQPLQQPPRQEAAGCA